MDAVTTVLKDLGISKKQAIRDYALLNASQKASEFKEECRIFEHKYNLSQKGFARKLKSQKEENFEEENDYLAWKFAIEGAEYWQNKINKIKKGL